MINIEMPVAMYPFFEGKARYRIAYGGRGGAKSWSVAAGLLLKAYQQRTRVLCARELQNSIKDSVHKLLADQIARYQLTGFHITDTSIVHSNGSEFIFKGLRTNANEIKSMEGIDVAWVEEAQKVSDESWEVLIPTIRKEDSEIWITFNPNFKTDATSVRFLENTPPNSVKVKINYWDNPWFSDELRLEMEHLKEVDRKAYLHVWEGEYKDPSLGGKVVPAWSFANVDESIEYQDGRKLYLTCDFNVDPMCWALAHVETIDGQRHYHFFDEIVRENTNITDCLKVFIQRYGNHKSGIVITGDANSGNARNDMDDLTRTRFTKMMNILSDYGVENYALDTISSNPFINQRVEAFNNMVYGVRGDRRVKVNPRCKQVIYCMENLSYIPGSDQIYNPPHTKIKDTPSLKFLRDDMFDAVSYLIWKYDPIKRETQKRSSGPIVPKALQNKWSNNARSGRFNRR